MKAKSSGPGSSSSTGRFFLLLPSDQAGSLRTLGILRHKQTSCLRYRDLIAAVHSSVQLVHSSSSTNTFSRGGRSPSSTLR